MKVKPSFIKWNIIEAANPLGVSILQHVIFPMNNINF